MNKYIHITHLLFHFLKPISKEIANSIQEKLQLYLVFCIYALNMIWKLNKLHGQKRFVIKHRIPTCGGKTDKKIFEPQCQQFVNKLDVLSVSTHKKNWSSTFIFYSYLDLSLHWHVRRNRRRRLLTGYFILSGVMFLKVSFSRKHCHFKCLS